MHNDDDLAEAVAEIERLWGAPEGSSDGDKLDVLATLVDAYESKRWPVPRSSPVEILRYAVECMGRSRNELGDLLGSQSYAAELIDGRRRIALDDAFKISEGWHIPIQLLIAPRETAVA